MLSPTQIQIFGERCSGTNYLEQLLRSNLSVAIKWDYGWKHYFCKVPIEREDHCLFIVIYRNPFDWLRSLHRKPHHAVSQLKRLSFSQFIRKEWCCIWDDRGGIDRANPLYNTEMLFERDPFTGRRFSNVMRLRTAKIKNWESLKNKASNTLFISYEALLENPQWHIDYIAAQFNIPKLATFRDVGSYKGNGKRPFEPQVYPAIGARDLEYIVAELDAALERRAGYDIAELMVEGRQRCPEKRGVLQVWDKLVSSVRAS